MPIRFSLGSRARRDDDGRADLSKSLAALVREVLVLPDEVLLTISEIACGDPACGGAETVVLVMRPKQKTQAFKIRMPMAVVGRSDIEAAAAGAGFLGSAADDIQG